MSQTYMTKSIDFATLLAYALPANSLIAAVKETAAIAFYFEGVEECKDLAADYWSTEPTAIGDLKAYNVAGRELRNVMKIAQRSGRWDRDREVAA